MSDQHPFPSCRLPSDLFFLPVLNDSIPLSFAHCRPNKFSSNTLGPSGSTLGLAPSEHLSQLGTVSILKQLLEKGAIKRPVFSLMLINSHEGVLSLGGTAADAVDMVVSQTKDQLDRLGDLEQAKNAPSKEEKIPLVRRSKGNKGVLTREANWEDGWAWSQVQGADGWWQILMQSVWVDGSTVLKNQAVVVDVSGKSALSLSSLANWITVGQQPLHTCPTAGSKGLLCRHFGFLPFATSSLKLLRIPMPQPTKDCFRIRG